jgi:hypothetical protein
MLWYTKRDDGDWLRNVLQPEELEALILCHGAVRDVNVEVIRSEE